MGSGRADSLQAGRQHTHCHGRVVTVHLSMSQGWARVERVIGWYGCHLGGAHRGWTCLQDPKVSSEQRWPEGCRGTREARVGAQRKAVQEGGVYNQRSLLRDRVRPFLHPHPCPPPPPTVWQSSHLWDSYCTSR